MTYKRFSTGGEAIRYAIEVIGTDNLWGATMETEKARLGAGEIRAMSECGGYPLRRLVR